MMSSSLVSSYSHDFLDAHKFSFFCVKWSEQSSSVHVIQFDQSHHLIVSDELCSSANDSSTALYQSSSFFVKTSWSSCFFLKVFLVADLVHHSSVVLSVFFSCSELFIYNVSDHDFVSKSFISFIMFFIFDNCFKILNKLFFLSLLIFFI